MQILEDLAFSINENKNIFQIVPSLCHSGHRKRPYLAKTDNSTGLMTLGSLQARWSVPWPDSIPLYWCPNSNPFLNCISLRSLKCLVLKVENFVVSVSIREEGHRSLDTGPAEHSHQYQGIGCTFYRSYVEKSPRQHKLFGAVYNMRSVSKVQTFLKYHFIIIWLNQFVPRHNFHD